MGRDNRAQRWITPSNLDEPEDTPPVDLVRDESLREDITRQEAFRRIKQYVRQLAVATHENVVFDAMKSRFCLIESEIQEAIDVAHHAERLTWAQNNSIIGAAKIFDPNVQGSTMAQKRAWAATVLDGRTFTNENRQALMDWLVRKAPILTLEEMMGLIVGIMGAWEVVAPPEPSPEGGV